MGSPFDPAHQNQKIEHKIVAALERISAAFRVLLWDEAKENALSPIQNQILIFLLFHDSEKCTVSYLAQEFNMTKATVSDSIKVLLKKGLITKFDHPSDTRSYIIGLTDPGKKTAEKSANFAFAIEKPLNAIGQAQKETMLAGLLRLIRDLNQAGVITVQRMCFSCVNYRFENGEHYCKLLKSKLADTEIRVDCPEHEHA